MVVMSKGNDKGAKKRVFSTNYSFNSQLPELEFSGNREVVIEGSKGVLEYDTNTIRINTNSMILCFHGRDLNLKCISPTALIINGFITNVEFVL